MEIVNGVEPGSETATSFDVNTGTNTTKAITPDALADSNFGTRVVLVKCIAESTDLTTGDGQAHFPITEELNGMNLVSVSADIYTVSSSGLPTIQIYNVTDSVDMLSTPITIDESEESSLTAATPAVIDTGNDDVVTGNRIRIDCDVSGTGAKGLDVKCSFRLP